MNLFFPPNGIPTFARAPLIQPGDPVGAQVVVLGVPWDGGTGMRAGARHGPRAIRETAQRFPLWAGGQAAGYWDVTTQQQRLAGVTVVDAGDVAIVRAHQEQTNDAITATARLARQSGGFLLTLGGDHSISFPLVRAFDDTPNLAIIQLDAHLDYADQVQGVRYNSSTGMRRVAELPFVGTMACLGLRGLRTDPAAFAAAQARGNQLITRAALRAVGIDALVAQLPVAEYTYLTLDIDVLDPTLAPGASAPELDGLSYPELRALLGAIARRSKIIGADIVELSPPLDPAGTTALAATQAAIELLVAVFG